MNRKSGFWVALWAVLVVVTGFLAFGGGPGWMGYGTGHDWGRTGWSDDSRVQDAYGGYGMGPGMMGGMGAGRGWGMMPWGMMGQMGAGMHGMGAGMGTGMMGGGYAPVPGQIPGLTSEQAQKLSQLQQEAQARNSSLAQQLWAAQDKLNLLLMNEKRDWSAIRAASQKILELQRQQHDAAIDLQQKVDGLLTDSQRQDMARSWRGYGWMGAQ
ncbi:Spy/CpxP family protein refolding chaperone [Thiobacillus sp.]